MEIYIQQHNKRDLQNKADQEYLDMVDMRDNYAILVNELCKNVTTVRENIQEEKTQPKSALFVERFLLWKQNRSSKDSSLVVLEIKQYTKSTEL